MLLLCEQCCNVMLLLCEQCCNVMLLLCEQCCTVMLLLCEQCCTVMLLLCEQCCNMMLLLCEQCGNVVLLLCEQCSNVVLLLCEQWWGDRDVDTGRCVDRLTCSLWSVSLSGMGVLVSTSNTSISCWSLGQHSVSRPGTRTAGHWVSILSSGLGPGLPGALSLVPHSSP